jgi:hypothetical protein
VCDFHDRPMQPAIVFDYHRTYAVGGTCGIMT